jgi:hypothetical protein
MLVPFTINQSVVDEFKIPSHIVDWTRVRILKIIDDKRFDATRRGNIDLSLDAMNALKFLELCKIANAKFDINGLVISIDPISYCFDVSKDAIVKALNGIVLLYKNATIRSSTITNYGSPVASWYENLRSNNWMLAKLGTGGQFPSKAPYNFYASIFTSNMTNKNFVSSGVVGSWYITKTITLDPATALMMGQTTAKTNLTTETAIKDALSNILFNDRQVSASVFSANAPDGVAIVQNCYSFIDPNSPELPSFVNGLIVEADISTALAREYSFESTAEYVKLCATVSTSIPAPIVAVVPNKYKYNPLDTLSTTLSLKNPSSGTLYYPTVVPNNAMKYARWYKRKSFTLHNGKTFTFPNEPYSPEYEPPSISRTSDIRIVDGVVNTKASPLSFIPFDENTKFYPQIQMMSFLQWNKSLFNFPVIFPTKLTNATLRIRNGYLFADASNFYELNFMKFTSSIIDKLATLTVLQSSIEQLIADIKSKEILLETSVDSSGVYTFKSVYWEFGVKKEFVHPISLKPILATEYLWELIVESAIAWGGADTEIELFLANLKVMNDNSYQKAYETYLRGIAVLAGPEAIAAYELKLKTGIFYSQNGFDYWRAFTPLELNLIAKFKSNALLAKDISDQNILILAQNKVYQDQVNAQVVKENQDKIAIAKIMAEAQLKTIADSELAKMVVPTLEYLFARAEREGGVLTDALVRWVKENPYYYLRADTKEAVEKLLANLTEIEQKVTTSLVADKLAAMNITIALQEMFTIK